MQNQSIKMGPVKKGCTQDSYCMLSRVLGTLEMYQDLSFPVVGSEAASAVGP